MEGLYVAHVIMSGSFWFWLLLFALFVVVTFVAEVAERRVLPAFLILATLLALQCFTNANPLGWAWKHPVLLSGLVVAYFFPVGTVWSAVRWLSFNTEMRARRDDLAEEFLTTKGLGASKTVPPHLREEWKKYIENRWPRSFAYYDDGSIIFKRPKLSDHKSRIMAWIAYWPFSMAFTVLNDPVRRVVKLIYHRMQGVYESISARVWAGTEDDFQVVQRGDK